jgi:hypothetical protein
MLTWDKLDSLSTLTLDTGIARPRKIKAKKIAHSPTTVDLQGLGKGSGVLRISKTLPSTVQICCDILHKIPKGWFAPECTSSMH